MTSEEFLETDPHPDITGVLLSDEIEFYIQNHDMIQPYNSKRLQAASYDVGVGEEYQQNGEWKKLTDDKPITLKPHEAIVISTHETLKMPRFMIGRWNPKVSKLFQGIVWVGGVHIDPGFNDKLYVPIYNLSRKEIQLSLNESIASIDFIKTTAFSSECIKYEKKPKSKRLHHAGSGLEEIRDEIKDFPKRIETYQTTTFTILGMIIAALSIVAILPFAGIDRGPVPSIDIFILIVGISTAAVAMSGISLKIARSKRASR